MGRRISAALLAAASLKHAGAGQSPAGPHYLRGITCRGLIEAPSPCAGRKSASCHLRGITCRGLIEACEAGQRSSEGCHAISAALLAAASLKPSDQCDGNIVSAIISAALLAAASLKPACAGCRGSQLAISAALLAAASLKRYRTRRPLAPTPCDLRGITCRGLIEATPWRHRPHLDGLISAALLAAASLKH